MTETEAARFAAQLDKRAGRYVATTGDRVVAWGNSVKEVREKAEKKKVKRVIIFPVPPKVQGHCYY